MDYTQAVAKGRELLRRSNDDQWELAELTHNVIAAGKHGTAAAWARDLGVDEAHVSRLKAMWARWGNVDHGQRSFAEYYTLVRVSPERAKDLDRRARRNGRSISTEQRGSRERDPIGRARELLKDPKARRFLQKELREREPKRRKPAPPTDHAGELRAIRDRLNEMLGEMLDLRLTKPERKAMSELVDDMELTLDWMRSYLRSGSRSFEDALEALLSDAAAEPPTPSPEAAKPNPPRRRAPAPPPAEPEPPPAASEKPDGQGGRRRTKPEPGIRRRLGRDRRVS